ncbi:MAG TPA: transcriptional regulator [Rhizobiaceae bacterium]
MSPKKSEAERAAAQAPSLAKQYRAIGPAAIVAALICAPKKKSAKTAVKAA